jgi:hypothetical protein
VNARRDPVPKAPEHYDQHIFAANLLGPRDHRDEPIECLHCPLLRGNAVHVSSEELVADLRPRPEEDRSDEMIGERDG